MVWLEALVGAILGMSVIVGVFWLTFVRSPDRRPEGGTSNSDADILLRHTVQDLGSPDLSHHDGGQGPM